MPDSGKPRFHLQGLMTMLGHIRRVRRAILAAAFLLPALFPTATSRAEDKSAAYLRQHKAVVLAARRYFDVRAEYSEGLRAFRPELERLAAGGERVLAEPDRLAWLVAQGRTFEEPFADKKQRYRFTSVRTGRAGRFRWFRSQEFSCAYSLPRSYPTASKLARYPRPEPLPLVIALHTKADAAAKKPAGVEVLARNYPYATHKPLHTDWLMLAPMAGAGRFLGKSGMVRHEVLTNTFRHFWRTYHVDFSRVILDGGQAALDVAASMPMFFAGIVLRDGVIDSATRETGVRNFAPLPAYVVGNKKLAERLRALGHPRVTLGDGSDLCTWMSAQRRRSPMRYGWDAATLDKRGSYWINVNDIDPAASQHRFDVEVVNTESAPNTVRIEAQGIRSLSVYLDDTLVDLDEPVTVLINGHEAFRGVLAEPGLGRDLKTLFYRAPFETRTSMYFGWLRPGWIEDLRVRARK